MSYNFSAFNKLQRYLSQLVNCVPGRSAGQLGGCEERLSNLCQSAAHAFFTFLLFLYQLLFSRDSHCLRKNQDCQRRKTETQSVTMRYLTSKIVTWSLFQRQCSWKAERLSENWNVKEVRTVEKRILSPKEAEHKIHSRGTDQKKHRWKAGEKNSLGKKKKKPKVTLPKKGQKEKAPGKGHRN